LHVEEQQQFNSEAPQIGSVDLRVPAAVTCDLSDSSNNFDVQQPWQIVSKGTAT
jgi:hypothetical protein